MKKLFLFGIIAFAYILCNFLGCGYFYKASTYGPPNVYIVKEGDCKFTLYYLGNSSSMEGPTGYIKFNEVEIEVENCKIVKNSLNIPVLDKRPIK